MRRIRTVLLAGAASLGVTVALVPPAGAAVGPLALASVPTPFTPGCNGAPQTGTLYPDSEVEPFVATDPTRPRRLVAVWQQDRWSNGGSQGLLSRVSDDGGRSWSASVPPPFSRCAGGSPANGGNYERASDPWVSFAPNGDAYFMALGVTLPSAAGPGTTSMLVARSRDGGHTWGPIHTLIAEPQDVAFNDKNALTADPTDSRYAYAVWDRLSTDAAGNGIGPTYLSRTTNGGVSWEPARAIYDPGPNAQTIGNQVAVLPNGTLLNVFTDIRPSGAGFAFNVAVIRSRDKGRTWSRPVFVDGLGAIGAFDPRDGAPVRDGSILVDVAVDPRHGRDEVYLSWQDARFTGGRADSAVLSRSADGGRTWSAPARVSVPESQQAFTPAVEVDGQGRVAMTYYDLTFDSAATEPLDTDFWVTRSRDAGRTFGPRERITPGPFDLRQAPVAGGFFLGDYTGLTVSGPAFVPVFAQSPGVGGDPTDIFSTRVTGPVAAGRAAAASTRVLSRTEAARLGGQRVTGKRVTSW